MVIKDNTYQALEGKDFLLILVENVNLNYYIFIPQSVQQVNTCCSHCGVAE